MFVRDHCQGLDQIQSHHPPCEPVSAVPSAGPPPCAGPASGRRGPAGVWQTALSGPHARGPAPPVGSAPVLRTSALYTCTMEGEELECSKQ